MTTTAIRGVRWIPIKVRSAGTLAPDREPTSIKRAFERVRAGGP